MDFRVERFPKIRMLPRPEDGLRAVVEHAPQAEEALDRLRERLRPAWTRAYNARRRLATSAVLFLTVWLALHVTFGANGMVIYEQKRSEIQRLRVEINDLQQQNARYGEQIKALKSDPQAIEKEAREQLHYARPGEVVYVPPNQANPQRPETNAARK